MAGALGVVLTGDAVVVEGRAAVPVYVDDTLPIVGPSRAVVVVTSGPMAGGPATPVRVAPVGTNAIGPALPVYVVPGGGSLGANPLAYTNKVIALAPIAYWPLAESSGTTIVDESGNGRNGVYRASGEPLLGQAGIGDGRTCPLFDGTNDFANVFSASLQGAFNSAEGTLALWFKVAAAGVWTDATTRRLMYFQADASNRVRFEKSTTNNQIAFVYTAGATAKSVLWNNAGPLGWQHIAITWTKSGDQMIAYQNGAQTGATQTALGTWVGNLAATTTAVGASDTTGGNPWSGNLAHAAVWASALSAAQIATLAVVP